MVIWKTVGCAQSYEISNHGQVKFSNKILKQTTSMDGYLSVTLQVLGSKKRIKRSVHRLVANAFIPNPDKKRQVNHMDCVKSNNWVGNLQWSTQNENMRHAVENALMPSGKLSPKFKGAILVFYKEVLISRLEGKKEIEAFELTAREVYACLRGLQKTHKGYTIKREGGY